jgi:Mlc titration factor MtfA (ptsG expression regulator)
MFAIAVENFFERPEQFRTHNPELFTNIGKLLNQGPMKRD